MSQFAAIPERHEAFREEKRLSALDRPLLSEGQLIYRRPTYLEKVTVAPRKELLLVDGDRLTLTGADGAPRELSLASHPEIGVLVDAVGGTLSGDIDRLQRSYSIQAMGAAPDWQLVLVPTNRRVQEMLRQIVIRGAGTAIGSVLTEQANGDRQVMTIVTAGDAAGTEPAPGAPAFASTAAGDNRLANPPLAKPPLATLPLAGPPPARSEPNR